MGIILGAFLVIAGIGCGKDYYDRSVEMNTSSSGPSDKVVDELKLEEHNCENLNGIISQRKVLSKEQEDFHIVYCQGEKLHLDKKGESKLETKDEHELDS